MNITTQSRTDCVISMNIDIHEGISDLQYTVFLYRKKKSAGTKVSPYYLLLYWLPVVLYTLALSLLLLLLPPGLLD